MRAPISSLKIVPVLPALNPYLLGGTLFLTVATDARLFRTLARQEREVFDTGDEGRLGITDRRTANLVMPFEKARLSGIYTAMGRPLGAKKNSAI